MKKNILFLICTPGLLVGAAKDARKSVSRSTLEAVAFTPASVIITAICAQAHNALTATNAQSYISVSESETLLPLGFTIPAGKRSSDAGICKGKLHVTIPFTDELLTEASLGRLKPDLSEEFHIRSGHGVYVFRNFRNIVAALKLTKDSTAIKSFKPLLAPWESERQGEIAFGHDGKIEIRVPGSLTKSVRGAKSKTVKK